MKGRFKTYSNRIKNFGIYSLIDINGNEYKNSTNYNIAILSKDCADYTSVFTMRLVPNFYISAINLIVKSFHFIPLRDYTKITGSYFWVQFKLFDFTEKIDIIDRT